MRTLLLITFAAATILSSLAATTDQVQTVDHNLRFAKTKSVPSGVIRKDGGGNIDDPGVLVHLHFDFDPQSYLCAFGGRIDNNNKSTMGFTYLYPNPGENPDTDVKIPEGTYDFLWIFYENKGKEVGDSHIVVMEDVTVSENLTLTFSPAEATVCYEFVPLLPDGEHAKLPVVHYDDNLQQVVTDVPGNVSAIYCNAALNLGIPRAEGNNIINTNSRMAEDPELFSTKIYVSPTHSGRYKPSCYAVLYTDGDWGCAISASSIIPEKPEEGVYSTIIENYTTLPKFDYVQSPYMQKNSIGEIDYGIYEFISFNRGSLTNGIVQGWNHECEVKFAWSPNAELDGICDGIYRFITDGNILYEDEFGKYLMYKGIQPQTIVPIDGEFIAHCVNYNYGQTPEMPGERSIPGYEPFCYNILDCDILIGNSVPVLLTNVNYGMNQGKYNFFPTPYGRVGEQRDNDDFLIRYTVKNDGATVVEGVGNLRNDFRDWQLTMAEAGKMEVELIDDNVEVDGIPAYNRTVITADYTDPDASWSAPVLMRLMTRNNDGKVVDRFATSDDGYFNFSCGNFTYDGQPVGIWGLMDFFNVTECDVKVEYAPNGTDNWQPLAAKKLSEEADLAFGYLYRCELADVKMPSSNLWYDVRISLTNEAGNTQQQTLSPVFRIDNLAGLSAPSVNTTSNAAPIYYNLQGIRVDRPAPGSVYIESSTAGTRKVRL